MLKSLKDKDTVSKEVWGDERCSLVRTMISLFGVVYYCLTVWLFKHMESANCTL